MRDVDEYSFFSEASGAARETSSWPKLSTATQQHGYADYSTCTEDLLSKEESGKQHCFVLGADFKLEKPVKEDREKVPLRHFFDEWPQKSKETSPWMDLEEHSSSKTQLSISIPAMTSRYHIGYYFPVFNLKHVQCVDYLFTNISFYLFLFCRRLRGS